MKKKLVLLSFLSISISSFQPVHANKYQNIGFLLGVAEGVMSGLTDYKYNHWTWRAWLIFPIIRDEVVDAGMRVAIPGSVKKEKIYYGNGWSDYFELKRSVGNVSRHVKNCAQLGSWVGYLSTLASLWVYNNYVKKDQTSYSDNSIIIEGKNNTFIP